MTIAHAYTSHETISGYCGKIESLRILIFWLTHNKMSLAKPKSPSLATLLGPKFVSRQFRAATSLQSKKKNCVLIISLKKNLPNGLSRMWLIHNVKLCGWFLQFTCARNVEIPNSLTHKLCHPQVLEARTLSRSTFGSFKKKNATFVFDKLLKGKDWKSWILCMVFISQY